MKHPVRGFHSLLFILIFATHSISYAAGVVTNATETDFRAALAGGGLVTIACDGKVTLAGTVVISASTTIDASGRQFTLSGGNAVQVLDLESGRELMMTNVTIADGKGIGNSSSGGILCRGSMTIVNCTFSNNVTTGFQGGGIHFRGTRLIVIGSTFVHNHAPGGRGGAIASGDQPFAPIPAFNVTNCTFYANSGGAIFMAGPQGPTPWIVNCTFVANTNSSVAITEVSFAEGVLLANNIFAGGAGEYLSGALLDKGHNISSDNSALLTNVTSLKNTDAVLGVLTNNGGPTLTMMPLPGSPAIGAANNAFAPPIDQRGGARPFGINSDIGSVEAPFAGSAGVITLLTATNRFMENNTNIVFSVFRSSGEFGAVSVDFFTANGSALAGQDFSGTNGTLLFAQNQTSNGFTLSLFADAIPEGTEMFALVLTNATNGAIIDNPVTTLSILDDETSFYFASPVYNIGETGGMATVTVNRSGPTNTDALVAWSTSDGTAVAGEDFLGASGFVTFSPGQASATFSVMIKEDGLVESDETVTLTLSNPSTGALGTVYMASLIIIENDTAQPGQIRFKNSSYSVIEAAGQAWIAVERISGSNVAVTINYATSDVSAVAGQDYTTTFGTLTFGVGETVKYFAIPISTNAPVESSETINLTLSTPGGGAMLISPLSAVLTINDASPVVVTCSDAALRLAVQTGGHIKLDCDGVIMLTNVLTISTDTIIDATGHDLMLSGSNATRLFFVNPGVSLQLRHLVLADGLTAGTNGNGAFGSNGGDARGGAIYNADAQVELFDCLLTRNVAVGGLGIGSSGFVSTGGAAFGGGIYSSNSLVWANNCTFLANSAIGGRGTNFGISGQAFGGIAFQTGGESYFWNCSMVSNIAMSLTPPSFPPASGGQVSGGALYQTNGSLELDHCEFLNNSAVGGKSFRTGTPGRGRGGAVYSDCSLKVSNSVFRGNRGVGGDGGMNGQGQGGALFLLKSASIMGSWFDANHANGGAGGSLTGSPTSPGEGLGGSIYNQSELKLINSTFSTNSAIGFPGQCCSVGGTDGSGGALFNQGTIFASNSTFFANRAEGGSFPASGGGGGSPLTSGGDGFGGAVCNAGGTVFLVHTTLADNSAIGGLGNPAGLSSGGGILNASGNLTLINTIVSGSPSGGNVAGMIEDGGHNISSDSSANFLAAGSLNNTDPLLGPFANFGGPTPTIMLQTGSPAINAADDAFALSYDQRGNPRPFGADSDIGAYEYGSPLFAIIGNVSGNTLTNEVQIVAGSYSNSTVNSQFSLTGLAAASYTVTPTHPNYVFFPATRNATVGPDQFGLHFNAHRWQAFDVQGYSSDHISVLYADTNGHVLQIQTSSNLVNWVSISTNVVGSSNLIQFSLPIIPGSPMLFYRAVAN
jgi:hypothetical protein